MITRDKPADSLALRRITRYVRGLMRAEYVLEWGVTPPRWISESRYSCSIFLGECFHEFVR